MPYIQQMKSGMHIKWGDRDAKTLWVIPKPLAIG